MKKLIIAILSLICVIACTFGLAACGDNSLDPPTHMHNYQWVDNNDGTHKQHCSVSGCDAPDINSETHIWGANNNCTKCHAVKPADGHIHSWLQSWSTSSTHHWHNCMANGCTITDNEQKDGYAVHIPGAAATETTAQVCTECGYVLAEPIGHTHSTTLVPAVSPSCTENGNIAYYTCNCGKMFSDVGATVEINGDSVIRNKLDHDLESHNAKAATCTEVGWDAYDTCSRCDYSTKIETNIDPNNHDTVQHEAQAANCTANGWNAYETCTRCNYTTKTDISATGIHSYADYVCDICFAIDSNAPITTGLIYGEIKENEQIIGYSVSKGAAGNYKYIKVPSEYNDKPITNIANHAFGGCSDLMSIEIPDSITSIGSYAFSGCSSLTSITIPNGVTSIGSYAFDGCSGLTIYCEATSKPSGWISSNPSDCPVVWDCLNNDKDENDYAYAIIDRIRYNLKDGVATVVRQPININGSITIRSSVTYNNASYDTTNIGSYAFKDCRYLASIEIPSSVTSIDSSGLFYGCSSLTSITVKNSNTKYHSDVNCIVETTSKTLIAGCKNSVIPIDGSVTSIGDGAFGGCSSLTSIEIPDSITSIGDHAFSGCSIIVATMPTSAIAAVVSDCKYQLQTVVINSGESIESHAFSGCRNLTSIEIPNSVTSIGSSAFNGCSSLTCIEIPNSVTSIGSSAFNGCSSLTCIEIPNSVTSIGDNAFGNCYRLMSITLPFVGETQYETSNTHFGYIFGAHSDSNNSNYVPNSLKSVIITGAYHIGSSAFSGCSSLTSITISNSVTSIGNYAFYGCSSITGIEIPNSVTNIEHGAFWGCSSLTSVTIPNSVTSIKSSVFANCISLTSIIIPNSVTNIVVDAFGGCSSLTSITVQSRNTKYHSSDNCLIETASKTLILGCNNSVIPKDGSVTSIGDRAFSGCSSLTSITIPNSVTSIGSSAFNGCSSLTCIEIPNSVTSIGNYAFSGCSSLTSIEIPNSVTSIGSGAFSDCSSLTSITIPNSVTSIGSSAFSGCNITTATLPTAVISYIPKANLKTVVINGGESIGSSAFNGCSSLTCIEIPNSVTSIGYNAFSDCSSLTSITIPNSVTSIGDYAFSCCHSLACIDIGDGVTSISNEAFSNCSSLTSITIDSKNPNYSSQDGILYNKAKTQFIYIPKAISGAVLPDTITSIMSYAFRDCSSLTSIEIPNSVTSIGNDAFSGCRNLTTATMPTVAISAVISDCKSQIQTVVINGGTSIQRNAFAFCRSLTSIEIPNSVTNIGDGAFSDCSNLTSITIDSKNPNYSSQDGILYNKAKTEFIHIPKSIIGTITIPNSITSIGSRAFSGCRNLTSIEIPNSVTRIGDNAFYDCRNLTSIEIPNSVTSIGSSAFNGCSSLTCIEIPNSVTSIGSSAFNGCSSLTCIEIPNSVTSIGDNAFFGCRGLTIYCEVASKPNKWENSWNFICPVVWDCKNNDKDENGYAYDIINGIRYSLKDGVAAVVGWLNNISGSITISSNVSYKGITYSVTSIKMDAFGGCSSLTGITIPNSVTSIESGAFSGCSSLTSITIPNSVTKIESYSFDGCSSLTVVTFNGTKAQWNAINKDSSCNVGTGNYTVTCTDGKLDKNGNEIAE